MRTAGGYEDWVRFDLRVGLSALESWTGQKDRAAWFEGYYMGASLTPLNRSRRAAFAEGWEYGRKVREESEQKRKAASERGRRNAKAKQAPEQLP